ncbi:hypothetical protein JCM10296v2_003198 [Rhodotorula toruloides]
MSSNVSEISADAPQLQPDLASPRLPPEILDRVLDHIDGKTWSYHRNPARIKYGRSISLVCRAWRERGTAWVWSRVDLDLTTRDETLQHMLKYPRTAKWLEMLYTKGPKLYEDVKDKFDSEERYKEAIVQNCCDLGRLFAHCVHLRELHIFSGHGILLETLFPLRSVAKHSTIKIVTFEAYSYTDGDAFMRMMHAVPGVEHLNVPFGLLTLDGSALTAENALVRRLPPMSFRDLYLDWSAASLDSLISETIFQNVLYAINPATLGQISLSPIGQTTLALLQSLIPTFTTLDYLCLHFDGRDLLYGSLGAITAAVSGLPKLKHLLLRTCGILTPALVNPAPTQVLSTFFESLPHQLETLELQAVFPPIAEDSHLVPDLILDFINSRANAPIISIDYRLRRADKVSEIALTRSHPRSDSAQGEDSASEQTSFVDLLNKVMRGEDAADETAALAVGVEDDGSEGDNEVDQPIENAATTADESPEILAGEVSPGARSTSSSLEVEPDQASISGRLRAAIQDLRSLRHDERITRHGSTVTRRNPKTGETLLHGWQIDSEVWKETPNE